MAQDRWAWALDQHIPSERGAGQSIIEHVLDRLAEHQWTAHDIFSVRLALEEAIVNAIKHGNRLDANKHVHVLCRISTELMWAQITDQGAGFDPEEVPDCTEPENLDRPSGRGIMLMRCYMSRVEYNDAGNIVVMEKRRTSSK